MEPPFDLEYWNKPCTLRFLCTKYQTDLTFFIFPLRFLLYTYLFQLC